MRTRRERKKLAENIVNGGEKAAEEILQDEVGVFDMLSIIYIKNESGIDIVLTDAEQDILKGIKLGVKVKPELNGIKISITGTENEVKDKLAKVLNILAMKLCFPQSRSTN